MGTTAAVRDHGTAEGPVDVAAPDAASPDRVAPFPYAWLPMSRLPVGPLLGMPVADQGLPQSPGRRVGRVPGADGGDEPHAVPAVPAVRAVPAGQAVNGYPPVRTPHGSGPNPLWQLDGNIDLLPSH